MRPRLVQVQHLIEDGQEPVVLPEAAILDGAPLTAGWLCVALGLALGLAHDGARELSPLLLLRRSIVAAAQQGPRATRRGVLRQCARHALTASSPS